VRVDAIRKACLTNLDGALDCRFTEVEHPVYERPKHYPISKGLLMEGFWRVNSTLSGGREETLSAEELRGSSARRETSVVVPSPRHPRWAQIHSVRTS
jgi:hypothetical protein